MSNVCRGDAKARATALRRLVWLAVLSLLVSGGLAHAQGTLTNGETHTGNIASSGQIDSWTFSATIGDHINLGIGEVEPTNNFSPWLRLLGPTGTLLANTANTVADQIYNVTAPQTGTYTVQVASYINVPNGTGGYTLTLAKAPGPFVVTAGDEGGPLTNGSNHSGTMALGDIDMWTFSAAIGDHINLGISEVEPTVGLAPWLRVVGPNGTLLANTANTVADQVYNLTAPLTGTYTVLVSSYINALPGTGGYVLTLAKAPGAFTLSTGDQGGAMTNGTNHAGAITSGDIDMWTFSAAIGDHINLGISEVEPTVGLAPWLRVVGPNGTLLANTANTVADQVYNLTAPLTGTYTVLVSSYINALPGTGDYVLTLAKAPGAFTLSSGDQGGAMTNGANHAGAITSGDIDMWTFSAGIGEHINLGITEIEPTNGLSLWLRVVGPTGTLHANTATTVADQVYNLTAPLSGTYTVLVSSYINALPGTGDYVLTLAKAPGAFTVSSGDQGGRAAIGAVNSGAITSGDIDMWTFVANAGNSITASLAEVEPTVALSPWMRLIGPTGTLLASTTGTVSTQINNLIAPVSGTYTLLVSSYINALPGTGGYTLLITGVPPQLPDLTIDFGPGVGLYALMNQGAQAPLAPAWVGLHPVSPTLVTSGRLDANFQDDLLLVFPGSGTWARFNNATWVQLHGLDASTVTAADLNNNGVDDVIVTFPGYGIWVRYDSGTWSQLHGSPASRIVAGRIDAGSQTDLVIDFPGLGVWGYYNGNTWVSLHGQNANDIKVANFDANPIEDIVVNLPGSGIYARYNNTGWVQLHPFNANGMATGNIDGDVNGRADLIINFPGYGVYALMNSNTWVGLHPFNAPRLAAADLDANGAADIILNFQGYGVWTLMNGANWVQLHGYDVESIVPGRYDTY